MNPLQTPNLRRHSLSNRNTCRYSSSLLSNSLLSKPLLGMRTHADSSTAFGSQKWTPAQKILLALLLNNGGLHLRSLSIMVIVVMFLPGKNMAGDVTLPERTKFSVPSIKSSSRILITRVWIVPLLVPARNTTSFVDREKSSDVTEKVTIIFDGRMAKGATRISRYMLTELAVALSFTLTESALGTLNRFVYVFMGVRRKR